MIVLHILTCSFNGGIGIRVSAINSFPILCFPTAPVKLLIPSFMKASVFINQNTYSLKIYLLFVRNICNSVVQAPYLFFRHIFNNNKNSHCKYTFHISEKSQILFVWRSLWKLTSIYVYSQRAATGVRVSKFIQIKVDTVTV